MCLYINENAKKRKANQDIICYKRVVSNINPYKGKSFTGIIHGIECEGKIQVEKDKIYFCTNDKFLDEGKCNDKLGYLYSWQFDNNIISIIVDGVDLMISTKDGIFITPYRGATVKLGETYTSKLIRQRTSVHIGLHSFTNYKDARKDGVGFIVKCIIPKGAKYYEGKFGPYPSYASNQIKYIEIITE